MPSFVSLRHRSRRPAGAAPFDSSGCPGWPAAALLLVLERPTLVLVALAGFLVRGGIVVLGLPILVLPTPVGLATIFGPDVVSVALAGPNPGIVRLAIIGAFLLGAWLVLGGFLGAAADVACIEATATSEAHGGGRGPVVGWRSAPRWRTILRVVVVRWLAHLPLVVALAWGVVRIVEATYAELVLPSDTATPLVFRVLGASPDAVVGVVGAWLLGEAWGGWAARFVVLGGRSVGSALRAAVRWFLHAPTRALGAFVAATIALGVSLVGAAAASATVWSVLRPIVRIDPGGAGAAVAVLLLVGVWLVGVWLVGVVVAWRAVAWTFVVGDPGR